MKAPIELFVVFRALGVSSDKAMCEYILLAIDDAHQAILLDKLQVSVYDANQYTTQEDALRYITGFAAYTPIKMDTETGQRKKYEFTRDVLDHDLFPHCTTMSQKLHFLGYMALRLLQTSFGWIPTTDRDSYVNKRIELTGTLLNNLFRNYFNKLVKEMQKQTVREINQGSQQKMLKISSMQLILTRLLNRQRLKMVYLVHFQLAIFLLSNRIVVKWVWRKY